MQDKPYQQGHQGWRGRRPSEDERAFYNCSSCVHKFFFPMSPESEYRASVNGGITSIRFGNIQSC